MRNRRTRGQAVLRDQWTGIYKVLVHGSTERRAERLTQELNLPLEKAKEYVHEADQQRLDFFKNVYDVEWLDSGLYDLALYADEVDLDSAVSLVMTGVTAVS